MSPFAPALDALPGLARSGAWPTVARPATLHQRPAGPGEPRLFALVLPPAPEAWLEALAGAASPARRAAAARQRSPWDALRCLASEALLRHAAGEIWSLQPADLATARGPHGKPAFVDQPDHHFNLSHSGPWILCALHDGPVGVDVEMASPRGLDAAPFFLSPQELLANQRLHAEGRLAHGFRLWTLKESLLKAAGTGLGQDPRTLTLGPEPCAPAGTPPAPPGRSWILAPLPMPAGVHAALCWAALPA